MYADLHIHSRCSDSSMTPQQAARRCVENGVGIAALADHNTWEGCAAFAAACRPLGVTPLRAVEISANHEGAHLHILVYGFAETPELTALTETARRLLLQMSDDLIALLSRDDPRIDEAEYRAFAPGFDHTKGGWAGLHYLLRQGVTNTLEEGIPFYRRYGMDYSSYPFPCAQDVCRAVRASGGVPVLAHPGSYYPAGACDALLAGLDALAEAGIGGVECYYPAHSPEITRVCLKFCARHPGFLVTAGSDCHGSFCESRGGLRFDVGATHTPADALILGDLPESAELF